MEPQWPKMEQPEQQNNMVLDYNPQMYPWVHSAINDWMNKYMGGGRQICCAEFQIKYVNTLL
jgi:hypothetical protein